MNKYVLTFVMAVGVLAAQSASATEYRNYYIHGRSCTSITSGQTPVYTQHGVEAPVTDAIDVSCPIVLEGSAKWEPLTYAWLGVYGYNRASTGSLYCTLASTGFDGNQQVTGRASVDFPASDPLAPKIGSVQITPGSELLFVNCHLPGRTSTGRSHVTALWLRVGFGK
jgi:hypothetical protein